MMSCLLPIRYGWARKVKRHNPQSQSCTATVGERRGVPTRWGDSAHGMPTLLDPVQAEEHHEPGPLAPFEPGSPPLLHLFRKRLGWQKVGYGMVSGPEFWNFRG